MFKKVLFALVVAGLVMAAIEGISLLVYFVVQGRLFSGQVVKARADRIIHGATDKLGVPDSQRDYLIDPYFGYVSRTVRLEKNKQSVINLARSYGFDTDGQIISDYPEKVFTVAIVGGSVAKYFAANMSSVLRPYLERLPQTKGKDIVILGLGNYSYKEPQQLNIINDFIAQGAHFDIVINLDGFNEVAHPAVHNLPNLVSPYFPSGWADRTGEVSSNANLALLGEMTLIRNLRVDFATFYINYGIGASMGTFWSLGDTLLARIIHDKEVTRLRKKPVTRMEYVNGLSVGPSGKVSFGSHRDYPPDELYPDLATHWALCSAILNNVVTSAGGKYYHFLQPNQYDKGSKVIGTEERVIAISDNPYRLGVERGYGLLRMAGKVLDDAGVDFVDTSSLFAGHAEILYRDDCCHYNKAGEEILAQKIGETILDSATKPEGMVSLKKIGADLGNTLENTGKIKRLTSINDDLVANENVRDVSVTGLWGDMEKNTARQYRWAVGPTTTITVWAPRQARIRIKATLLSATPDQVTTVVANGASIAQWKNIGYTGTATSMTEKSLEFPVQPGKNVIELRYATYLGDATHPVLPNDPRHLAVMYQSLLVKTFPDLSGHESRSPVPLERGR